ncbi:MAG: hypothetical protein BWY13_01097 [Euryarchaeota archaeon ADurb.Bin190]|nr:MAG: hypothetical protein BWY13_01097 [Euryarchaeota archaeon ADurb.Bin190]
MKYYIRRAYSNCIPQAGDALKVSLNEIDALVYLLSLDIVWNLPVGTSSNQTIYIGASID